MNTVTDPNLLIRPLPEVYDRLRFDGAVIYTADPARPVIEEGSLLIEGSTILAVGTNAEVDAVAAGLPATAGRVRRVDASRSMIMPGLVNNHWHEASALRAMQGLNVNPDDTGTPPGDMAGGMNVESVTQQFNGLLDLVQNMPEPVARLAALHSYVTQLRAGTTCVADFGSANRPDILAQAVLDTGIRGVVTAYAVDGECRTGEAAFVRTRDTTALLGEAERMLEQYRDHDSGRLRAMPTVLFGPNASDALLIGSAGLAEKYDTPLGFHLATAANETTASRRYFGVRPVERLHRLGLLSRRLICAHTAYAEDDEFNWLLQSGAHLTYSPQKYGATGEATISATRQIMRFIAAGAPVCLSADGDPVPLGYMPESMRMGWLAFNEAVGDSSLMTPMRALSMATLAGARSLGWDDQIGSLAAGKKADFFTVPVDDWRYVGIRRPLNSFLVMGSSGDVDTVVVDGRILVEQGKATFVDEAALSAAFLQASIDLAQFVGGGGARVPGT